MGTVSLRHFWNPVGRFVCLRQLQSDESGNLLNMIMDTGAEKHVVSLADWKSLGEPLLKPAQVRLHSATGGDMGVSGSFVVRGWCDNQMVELTVWVATRATKSLCSATKLVSAGYIIEMRPTQSVLRRSGGGCTLLQRCSKRDFLSIRLRKSCEINAITFSTMKREVQSLKSELRALRTGHLSTSEVRLPWTPEEKLRHESNGRAEYDNRCEICVKSSGISRHPRRVYSESCAFDYFKESDGYVTVLTGRGPRCECFCQVVPRKGQRLKDLEHFLAVMRARYPCLSVRSDNEEALKRVLTDACEQMHKEMIQRALALMTEYDWRTLGCKTCQDVRYHKVWHSAECRERVLLATVPDTTWPVATTKRLLDTTAEDARDDHLSKRHKSSFGTVSMPQVLSSGSGVKRSNLEAIRRADAEAEKALKRAKLEEERRASKRASQHQWMNWWSLRRTQRCQLKRRWSQLKLY